MKTKERNYKQQLDIARDNDIDPTKLLIAEVMSDGLIDAGQELTERQFEDACELSYRTYLNVEGATIDESVYSYIDLLATMESDKITQSILIDTCYNTIG